MQNWIPRLLRLPTGGAKPSGLENLDLTVVSANWAPHEAQLLPPMALLSWLVRNCQSAGRSRTSRGSAEKRARLQKGDPAMVSEALQLLRSRPDPKAWYVLEGASSPDVFLETPDALIAIEGKRTEPAATTSTSWMDGRRQIWRHIDGAWEVRGRRQVFGFFIVEGGTDPDVPRAWRDDVIASLTPEALAASFPHRGAVELAQITSCLLGATTWQAVCREFGIEFAQLPDTIA
jgi:hypothetical protein